MELDPEQFKQLGLDVELEASDETLQGLVPQVSGLPTPPCSLQILSMLVSKHASPTGKATLASPSHGLCRLQPPCCARIRHGKVRLCPELKGCQLARPWLRESF